MMSYAVAETDELEAFGRDDIPHDTSAGLDPEDQVEENLDGMPRYGEAEGSRAKGGKRCLFLSIFLVTLVLTAAFFGIFFGVRGGRSDKKGESENGEGLVPVQPDMPQPPAPNLPTAQPVSLPAPAPAQVPEPAPVPVPAPVPAPVPDASARAPTFKVTVLETLPHDRSAFLQGFEFSSGSFYESTGLEGRSSLRKVEMATGNVLQIYNFTEPTLFGEGMTLHTTHHIFMLTWRAGRGFIFNQTTLELMKEWKYEGEGWGLTMDRTADEVYMSDGTDKLRVLDPEDLSEKRRVAVTLNGESVRNINELEWICGEVWANIWLSKFIYRIDPVSGVVKSVIDAKNLPLRTDRSPRIDVLNGIAFDSETGRLWLTGKLWPVIYRVSINDESLDLENC